jgi:hypothetical protein
MDPTEPPPEWLPTPPRFIPVAEDNSMLHEIIWIGAGIVGGTLAGIGAALYSLKLGAQKVFGKDPEVISRG